MKVPSAVILSEAIRLYCVVETRSASVKRSDLAAVKSDGTPHPSATPPPSPNADARGRQKIDFVAALLIFAGIQLLAVLVGGILTNFIKNMA